MKKMLIVPVAGKFSSFTRCAIVALFLLTGIHCFAQDLSLIANKPGQIARQIKGKEDSIVSLTISGAINGKDMEAIYALPNLIELNLKDAVLQKTLFTLIEGKTKRKITFSPSKFPFLFSSNLKTLHLPESVRYILTRNDILASAEITPIATYEAPQLDNLYLYGLHSPWRAESIFAANNKIAKNLHLHLLDFSWEDVRRIVSRRVNGYTYYTTMYTTMGSVTSNIMGCNIINVIDTLYIDK